MHIRTKAAIGSALALSITLSLAGQAFADPPSGVTPLLRARRAPTPEPITPE